MYKTIDLLKYEVYVEIHRPLKYEVYVQTDRRYVQTDRPLNI